MSRIEEEISLKLKSVVYKKLLRMPISWYQQPQNEGGQAASNYGVDVVQMSTLTTTYIPVLITNITTMVAGVVICLVYYWRIGLLTLYTIPLIAAGWFITMIFISGYDD
jgi:ATP-binding cassette subfamily B (MDR/TAP) protein 1